MQHAVTPPEWSLAPPELYARLASGPEGLAAREAAVRLAADGPNVLAEDAGPHALALLGRQVASPLVLILIAGAAVSLFLRDWTDAAIVLAVVIGSIGLGFTQEYRASRAVADLRRRLQLIATVRRDGTSTAVPAREVVRGDVVLLSAGNLVPADGVLLEARDFLVVEAALTGESFPVEKQAVPSPPDAPLPRRTNALYLGTSVRSGTAAMLVTATGAATALGAIAARVRADPPETEFERGVRDFGYLLVRVMIVMVLFVLTVNAMLDRPALTSLMFAMALAIGLSPELLPAIVSVTLSAGARDMARHGVLVRRLDAIENLGSMSVLCTDKTGTLTEGTVALDRAVAPDGRESPAVLRLAFLNAALETGIANPLDAALVAAGGRAGLGVEGVRKLDEIPYDFARRRLTIVIDEGAGTAPLIVTKGAFDAVASLCTWVDDGEAVRPLDDAARAAHAEHYARWGAAGQRVLALAWKRGGHAAPFAAADERDMTFAGFLLFSDPPKADAGRTLEALRSRGVAVKIVSGDNRHVTANVAAAVGLDAAAMLTGAEVAALSEEALGHRAERTDLFVEVDPQQKERIVRALQRRGLAVGFLGDGINDAPALHAADVGISVSEAVDVARESADIVLLERDLDVLAAGVDQGRRTFANTLKYIAITTSANFGNMVSMAIATPLLPFLPLAAKQILLNNFASDLPSMAISTDNVDAERLRTAQRWDVAGIRSFMIVFGLVSTAFDLLTFGTLILAFGAGEPQFQTAWFVVSLLTELAAVLVLRTHGPAYRSRPSTLLAGLTVAVAAVTVAVPYVPAVAAPFGFVPLSMPLLAFVFAVVAAYAVATEAAKRVYFTRRGAPPPAPGAPP